jgi:SulP family sulfate permease
LVGFMESISASKSIARRKGYDIEPNQELIALGAASLVGSFFGAYPINGGLSRTAVNAQAGARTPLAGLLTAGVVALSLLFFTPALRAMPKAALAAIIVSAVAGMIDVAEVKRLWKLSRVELALMALTAASTLALGIEVGIFVGVGASLLWFIVRSTRPHYAVLGRLPNTSVFRNVKNFPEACVWPGLLIVRMDAKLYFGNVSFLKETLASLEAQSPSPLRAVILDAASINDLDSSADAALHELLDGYQRRGVTLSFAQLKGPVREVMRRSGLYDRLGADRAFFTLEDAVQEATQRLGLSPPDACRRAPLSEADYAAQTHRPCLSHHKG